MLFQIAISIHAPHEGERRACALPAAHSERFQSTLPTRGSDTYAPAGRHSDCHFNPRSPRGGATCHILFDRQVGLISIHAPHEGERPQRRGQSRRWWDFNPRSPRGGATGQRSARIRQGGISIHAPHEGERQEITGVSSKHPIFQSTLPTRGSDTYTPLGA